MNTYQIQTGQSWQQGKALPTSSWQACGVWSQSKVSNYNNGLPEKLDGCLSQRNSWKKYQIIPNMQLQQWNMALALFLPVDLCEITASRWSKGLFVWHNHSGNARLFGHRVHVWVWCFNVENIGQHCALSRWHTTAANGRKQAEATTARASSFALSNQPPSANGKHKMPNHLSFGGAPLAPLAVLRHGASDGVSVPRVTWPPPAAAAI